MELVVGPPLAAGRYTRSGFEPRITFQVADQEWQAVQLLLGFFDVQQDRGTPDVIAVQFGLPDALFGTDLQPQPLTKASEAIDVLKANPTLTVVSTSTPMIGGLDAYQVTVDTAGESEGQVMHVPPGALQMDPARRMWIAFIDAPGGGVLAVIVGGSVAKWDAAMKAAQPVLASVTIGQ
jgi:hypothetical protein